MSSRCFSCTWSSDSVLFKDIDKHIQICDGPVIRIRESDSSVCSVFTSDGLNRDFVPTGYSIHRSEMVKDVSEFVFKEKPV